MREHYEDEDNYGKFWNPVSVVAEDQRELEAPVMLLCPKALGKHLLTFKQDRLFMPHELREALGDWIPTTGLSGEEAQLAIDWSILAANDNGNGNSVVAFDVHAIINEDPRFSQWVQRRLDGTIGPRPAAGATQGGGRRWRLP